MELFVVASVSIDPNSDCAPVRLPLSPLRVSIEIALFAGVYFLAGMLGLMTNPDRDVAPIWLPTGLSLGVLWLRGYLYLPGVILGQMAIGLFMHFSPPVCLAIAAGNGGEAALGLWLLRRHRFNPRLETIRDVAVLTLLPMPLATLISALTGSGALWLGGVIPTDKLPANTLMWWLGNAVSIAVVTPLILTWWYWWRSPMALSTRREVALTVAGLIISSMLAYSMRISGTQDFFLLLISVPFLTIVSLRYSSRGSASAVFAVAIVSLLACLGGASPFNEPNLPVAYGRLNIFLGVIAINAMILCALMRQRMSFERILRREHETFTVAESLAKIGSFQSDEAGKILWWSDEMYRLVGRSPEEPPLDYFHFIERYVHPEDREDQRRLASDVLADPTTRITSRFRIVTADGLLKHIDCQGRPSLDSHGRLADYIGALQDITDRVSADEALRASESRYRLLADHSSDVITRQSIDGALLYVSPSVVNLVGYTPEEMAGRRLAAFIHPEDLPYIMKVFSEITEAPTLMAFRVRHRDGNHPWVEVSGNLIRPVDGPPEIICQLRDVSERKRLEDQMRQSQKMEAVGRLAGGVAHDFNNLLTVINGFSEVLQEMIPEEDAARALVTDIREAGLRAASLTKQLLAFSRRQNVSRRVLDLNDAVRNSQSLLSRLVGDEVRLKFKLSPGRAAILADSGQVDQVLMNLVLNARDAIPGGGEITMSVSQHTVVGEGEPGELPPGDFIVLAVSDTGAGIDEATRALIFEPFFSTKEQGKGSGLGLATVYAIMQQADGRITVESEVGQGTTIRLFWPAIESALPASTVTDSGVISLGDGEVILLVEDDNAVRHLTSRMLRDRGYRVLEASDGLEAIRVSERRGVPVDLVVTDVVMPQMNGRELATHLYRMWPKVPVLFLSGYTNDAIFRRSVGEESVELLTKPFTADGLLNKVRELIDAKPVRA